MTSPIDPKAKPAEGEQTSEDPLAHWESLFKNHGTALIYVSGILLFWGFFFFVFYLFVHYGASSSPWS